MGHNFVLNFAALTIKTGRGEMIVEIKNSHFSTGVGYFKSSHRQAPPKWPILCRVGR